MNVFFIDQFSDLGGGQLCLVDVLKEARRRGWHATLAAPGDGPLIKCARALGVDCVDLRYDSVRPSLSKAAEFAVQSSARARVLTDVIRAREFDLVYVNGPRVLPAAVWACGSALPLIFHAHNRPVSAVARSVAGWSLRLSRATVVACCRFVAHVYRPYVTADRLHIVPNGVTNIPYTERTFAPPLLIGTIGRIESEKSQMLFVEAARGLVSEGIESEFVVCGSPGRRAGAYADAVKKAAAGLPFRFMPWQADVAELLRSLDLLVVPSMNEGMPRVILEAFSAGVPVIAFRTGGIPEVVREGETGFLFDQQTGTALAAKLLSVCRHPRERLASVAANARECWDACHTAATFTASVADIMIRVVQEHVTARRTGERRSRIAPMR